MQVFDILADYERVREACGHHGRHEVREGRDAVHEDPETGKLVRGRENTTEDETEGEEKLGKIAGRLSRRHTGDHHVGEGASEDHKSQDKEEHESAAFSDCVSRGGVVVKSYRIVPSYKDKEAHEGVPGQFDDDICEDEDLPRVGFGGPLAHFVKGTLSDEVRHDLLDKIAESVYGVA